MRYRDARGRWRKPTDEERWPNERERKIAQNMREMMDSLKPMWAKSVVQSLNDVQFYSGEVWPR